ncbi:hypothetical protein BCR41DRAFT_399662 [Lobosporangium transversale]|uniref:Uncharacterized protein n=1 Tax=Lobosporangium transversale TaxID=64571 RepID=A0A1Y2GD48_9FUNG|nr:hypothetical protein BCR41DRAFT_399662 [Lobosporangium transversale]ORZ07516.1 hypothetical protein BCR41DRAFT_399662 [Lobosporangium transversale]|eukprot:XP_021878023.1 hypothetical protein BCR41DRAFT_399662 [Lobosporangium transversale]
MYSQIVRYEKTLYHESQGPSYINDGFVFHLCMDDSAEGVVIERTEEIYMNRMVRICRQESAHVSFRRQNPTIRNQLKKGFSPMAAHNYGQKAVLAKELRAVSGAKAHNYGQKAILAKELRAVSGAKGSPQLRSKAILAKELRTVSGVKGVCILFRKPLPGIRKLSPLEYQKLPPLKAMGLHDFFLEENPSSWTPSSFASHPLGKYYRDYIGGLISLKANGSTAIRTYCSAILRYLQSDAEGQNLETEAKKAIDFKNALHEEKIEELTFKAKASTNFLKTHPIPLQVNLTTEGTAIAVGKRLIRVLTRRIRSLVQENVDDVNVKEAIEIQRIPQLGRSKSYEKQLEVESTNKFYDNTATGVHIRFLNQVSEWMLNEKDVLAIFNDFKRSQETNIYSLSRDGIADLTSRSDFIDTLADDIFNQIVSEGLDIEQDDDISDTLSTLFRGPQASFEDALEEAVKIDRSNRVTRSITAVLENFSMFFPHHGIMPKMNERQFFSEIVIPSFRHAFRLVGKDMELFEIKILGCQRRKNLHRIPMQEKAVHAHQVDATVSHDGLQVVLFECSPPDAKDADKAFSDHFKLTRDLKDTWIYNVEAMIQNGREPTRGLTVYGVHIARNRLELYALDFMGCFRLHECTTITLPTRLSTFQTCFQELVQKSFWFAKQVRAELDKWDSAQTLEQSKKRKAERALKLLPKTNTTPTKGKKVKMYQGEGDQLG